MMLEHKNLMFMLKAEVGKVLDNLDMDVSDNGAALPLGWRWIPLGLDWSKKAGGDRYGP